MLYITLVFDKSPTIDALVDSRAFVRAIAQNELNSIKQQAPCILKIEDPSSFRIQIANGQLEKPYEKPHSESILKNILSENTLLQ